MNPIANRSNFKILVAALFSLALVSTSAAITVSYQGILTNAGGDSLLTGQYDFVFGIYPQATGGTARWTETHNTVDVESGIYSVILGSTTALPDSIGDSSWLQITVDGTPLTPRLPITADFRAIEARRAQNADSVNHIPASTTPQANHLLPLDADAKVPAAALPFTLDSILAGAGLTGTVTDDARGGSRSLDDQLSINVGAGDGIIANPNDVAAVLGTTIQTNEIDNNAVTTPKIADGAILNAKIAANAVTTDKVQDNTLVVADIAPDIVSSVDGVHNDGGDIDLIPGPHIGITPNDANNTITISADAVQYLAGRCIDITDSTINNVMDIVAGDGCISVEYDSSQCLYTVRNLMDIAGGECVFVEYDSSNCNYLISIDPDCIPVGTADSIFHSEVYAHSFVIAPDGPTGNTHGHWDSDGRLALYLDNETGMVLNPNGTWGAYQNNGITPVAGLDTNGELFARSMMVIDSTGDTLIHLRKDGGVELDHNDSYVQIFPEGMYVGNATGYSHYTPAGMGILNEDGKGMSFNSDGTWQASTLYGSYNYAGLDGNGELFAKSFEVRDSITGEVKAHLTYDGNLALPANAQITIGGNPIGQGGTDSVFNSEVYAHSFVVTPDGSLENETAHVLSDGTFQNRNANDDSGFDIHPDGTMEVYQGDPDIPVAGIDDEGEMYANSFYVPGLTIGSMLAHITATGDYVGVNHVASGYMYSPSSIFSGNANGSQVSDLAPSYMRSQTYSGATPVTGWTFMNTGAMTQRVTGSTEANMQAYADGRLRMMHELIMGTEADNNHFLGLGPTTGIGVSHNMTIFGNLTVVGKLNTQGAEDPLVCESFATSPSQKYEAGTVIVADPNSEKFVPCYNANQTSVVGVIAPDQKVDNKGNVLAIILGSAAAYRDDGTRLEARIKADAKYGAIHRGDLLTTSATVGHAMLASDPKLGTIIGKALESLAVGTGEIKVMVTLQ